MWCNVRSEGQKETDIFEYSLLNDKVGDECLNSSLTFVTSVFSTMTWKQVIAAYLRLIKLKAAPREVSTYGYQINQSRYKTVKFSMIIDIAVGFTILGAIW